MAEYTITPASEAERNESGNPELVYINRDGSWLLTCDREDADTIAASLAWVEKAQAYKERVAKAERDISELFNEVGL